MKTLIGCSGAAGAGKTSVANHLVENYGFVKISFADEIKKITEMMFPHIPKLWIYGTQEDKMNIDPLTSKTVREIMQLLGTEIGRSLHRDIWVNMAHNKIKIISEQFDRHRFVIDDVRFINEAKWLQKELGILLFIDRDIPSIKNPKRVSILGRNIIIPGMYSIHASERDFPKINEISDFIINSNQSLKNVYKEIDHKLGTFL